jgi:ATP-dependent DNA helicase RecQ
MSAPDITDILRKNWGYDSFRPAQKEIITSILSGHDTIGLLPTGGGKSITFQVPALATDGLTVVVTPLISLMKDQIDNLRQRGILATYLHAALTRREQQLAIDRCRLGKAKLLYLSPEKLQSPSFLDIVRSLPIRIIVVDEAHCISQWGYDFRPSYLKIAQLRKLFPQAPVLALTASATPHVLDDIAQKLQMASPAIFRLSFARDNLSYIVRYTDYKEGKLLEILTKMGGCSIVYVRSRKRARELAMLLANEGHSADYYHAGLAPEEKELRQNKWKSDQTRIMVATNAFGMGIDKPDVRLVIHYDLPSSLEEYYQEAGRGGRDGLPSLAVLLVAKTDKALLTRRLNEAFPPKDQIRHIYNLASTFLDVVPGEGYNHVYEFNLAQFCSRFNLKAPEVVNALSIMTQAGHIEYSDQIYSRARVMMLMQRSELYDLQLPVEEDRVLNKLLRTYTGLFADYEPINEGLIACELDYTEDTVYNALLALTRRHVLHYIPRRTCPYILYTRPCDEGRHLPIPIEVYEQRRQRMEERITAMKQFAFGTTDCRVNTMLRYFGEKPTEPCGKCDVCRATARFKNDTDQQLQRTILSRLSPDRTITIDTLINSIPGHNPDTIIDRLRDLIGNSTVINDNGLLTLPK